MTGKGTGTSMPGAPGAPSRPSLPSEPGCPGGPAGPCTGFPLMLLTVRFVVRLLLMTLLSVTDLSMYVSPLM